MFLSHTSFFYKQRFHSIQSHMVDEMLQKSKILLYVLYSCYIKFCFDYRFHIYVICFLICLSYIHMFIMFFLNLLHISISIIFDLNLCDNVFIFITCAKLL